jgi:site-specific recombinase XerD
MLDSVRVDRAIQARLRAGPLARYIDGFVEALQEWGYAELVVRLYVRAADLFGEWLVRAGLGVRDIDEATVERFVTGLGRYSPPSRPRGRVPDIACGVRRLAEYLWQEDVANRRSAAAATTEVDRWLQSYDDHLIRVGGLAPGTRQDYLRYARKFVEKRFGAEATDWSAVSADDIADFVLGEASRLGTSACRRPATAMRALLRFLTTTGAVRSGLDGAVPAVRQWKHAALPGYLSPHQMQRALAQCDESPAMGRRDLAILLLLARLGLRAGEVAALELGDIDWREGCVRIRAGKTGRERCLPLPDEVGNAIVAYLRHGRANPPYRAVFLRIRAPLRPLTAAGVSDIAHRALVRAEVSIVPSRAHVFRHTAATHMVRNGATFKEVADVLGHARIETTAIYAKLDVATLSRVAMPWPGGAP